MDTLPLPPRPNLEQYKKRAKDLVSAAKKADDDAVRAWATKWLETLADLLGVAITPLETASIGRSAGSRNGFAKKPTRPAPPERSSR